MKETANHIRTLVASNKISEALNYTLSLIEDKELTKNTILLKQQFLDWRSKYFTGQNPPQELKNRIVISLLNIADQLEEGKKVKELYVRNKEKNYGKKIEFYTRIFLIILLLGIISNFYSNYKTHQLVEEIGIDLRKDNEVEKADGFYNELSLLLNNRFFRQKKLVWFYQEPKGDFKQRRKKLLGEYTEAVDLWNTSLAKNSHLLERYFGLNMRVFFVEEIHDKIVESHLDLIEARSFAEKDISIYKNKLDLIEDNLEDVGKNIDILNLRMLTFINEKNVGKFIKYEYPRKEIKE